MASCPDRICAQGRAPAPVSLYRVVNCLALTKLANDDISGTITNDAAASRRARERAARPMAQYACGVQAGGGAQTAGPALFSQAGRRADRRPRAPRKAPPCWAPPGFATPGRALVA